jgi:hypothetical protein
MEVLKQENGWKLGKKENIFYLICPSGEERKLSVTSQRNLDNAFNHAVENNWTWLDRTYFVPSVVKGKVRISKESSTFVRSDKVNEWEKGRYLTEEAAKAAIEKALPMALEKFILCQEKHNALCRELGFSLGFNYDGDSHGIYNEYQYISFTLDGFSFQFPIED